MGSAAIDAVIFDFDGTILDTELSEFTTVSEVFARFGHEYPIDHHRSLVGRADHPHWSDALQALTGPLDNIEQLRADKLDAHHAYIADLDIRPGVVELIDRATAARRRLAVASSSPLSWVSKHLDDRGLSHHFPVVATRDIVAQAKPWPDVFLAASQQLDVDPARCLVVEDSVAGVTAAKAAGMVCVAVPNPITEASDFSQADLVLGSLADLPYDQFGL
jgi:HAD superfamily hydrolase (TIGR01509 family)